MPVRWGWRTICLSFASMLLVASNTYRIKKHYEVNNAYANDGGHLAIFKATGLDHLWTTREKHLISATDQELLIGKLQNLPEIAYVGRYLYGVGLISTGCKSIPFVGLGVDLTAEDRSHSHPDLAKWLGTVGRSAIDHNFSHYFPESQDIVAITPTMAKSLGKSGILNKRQPPPESTIDFTESCDTRSNDPSLKASPYVQVLTQEASGDSSIHDAFIAYHYSTAKVFTEDTALRAPLHYMQRSLNTKGVSYLGVFLNSGANTELALQKVMKEVIGDRSQEFTVYSTTGMSLDANAFGQVEWLQALQFFTFSLLGSVIAVIIGNFVTMTIRERRKEIGTLRALGFKPRVVMSLIQKEAYLVSGLGLFVGIVTAYSTVTVVNALDIHYEPPGVSGVSFFRLAIASQSIISVGSILFISSTASAFFALFRSIRSQRVTEMLAG
ncbi:hypothetical protein E3A20_18370 [Planctomyces bekefii]|uniref:ABC3 transporter permease C-terminal domain-containing protein n=1 Tax=Planctomyces bekefii TaxID=1653850 RepID=A0A5C6M7E7_9PLAN|nr:hypothetical protein E3A20_18370 [Planctomyces bekefii]